MGSSKRKVTIIDDPKVMSDDSQTSHRYTGSSKDNGGSLDIPPTFERRRELQAELGTPNGAFVGLYNLGATCYMNSLLQSLFWTPEFREHILRWNFDEKQRHAMNVAFQLQLIFARMQQPNLRDVLRPDALVKSFGMGEDAHREQHDVQELNRKLLEVFQYFIDCSASKQLLHYLYRGHYVDYRKCAKCGSARESRVPFDDLSLPIRGHASLEESFRAYETAEEIEGVMCEVCGTRETLLKGMKIAEFPRVLSIQLGRIDYNPVDFQREKVTSDFALPESIVLPPEQPSDSGRGDVGRPRGECHRYSLHSIIVHRGTAYHGHYYAYVRFSSGSWVKFDDSAITFPAADDEVLQYRDPAAWRAQHGQKAATAAESPRDPAAGAGNALSQANNDALMYSNGGCATTATSTEEDDLNSALLESVFGEGAAGASPGEALHSRKVSGHSYYAVYRRDDMQPVPLEYRVPALAPALAEVLSTEEAALQAKRAELARLESIASVAMHRGSARYWLDVPVGTCIGELRRQMLAILCEQTGGDEGCAGGPERFARPSRLRAYSPSLKCMGDSYDNEHETLQRIGVNPESTAFSHFAIEFLDEACPRAFFKATKGWDHALNVHWPKEDAAIDFEADYTIVHVPTTATIGDLKDRLLSQARDLLGVIAPDQLCLTLRRDGEGRVIGPPSSSADEMELVAQLKLQTEDHIFVEKADATRWDYDAGSSRAAEAIAVAQLIAVKYTLLTTAGDVAMQDAVLMFDRRKSVGALKEALCTDLGLEYSASQLLLDNATRELRSLSASLQTMALGQATMKVTVDPRPPIPADHAAVDVFVANVGNYAHPVTKVVRTSIAPDTTTEQLLAIPEVRAVLPLSPACRLRMMPPSRGACLGTPMLHPLILKNCPAGHRQDELRIVLEPIAAAETLTKDSLILHVHLWRSEIAEFELALGPGRELVVDRNATADTVRCAAVALFRDTLSSASVSDTSAAAEVEVAAAKPYQLRSHDSVCAKLRWDYFLSPKVLGKSIHAHPLRLEMDDVLLLHRTAEPWLHASCEALHAKQTSDARSREGDEKHVGTVGGKKKKRAAVAERGITIQAVWEMTPASELSDDSATASPSCALETAAVSADAGQDAASAPPTATTAPPASSGVIDFLPYDTYSVEVHGALDAQCNICMCEFEPDEVINVLGCHHVFHRECLAPWLDTRTTCPQCNENVLQWQCKD